MLNCSDIDYPMVKIFKKFASRKIGDSFIAVVNDRDRTMQAGSILKIATNRGATNHNLLGVVVNALKTGCEVIVEDGSNVDLFHSEAKIVGYNGRFKSNPKKYDSLYELVRANGKKAILADGVCCKVPVLLTSSDGKRKSFFIGFDANGDFYITDPSNSESGDNAFTVNAWFGFANLDVDGNGWRDLESGNFIESFVSQVIFGKRDPNNFLLEISVLLDSDNEPGIAF